MEMPDFRCNCNKIGWLLIPAFPSIDAELNREIWVHKKEHSGNYC
jgi:hypothetical protein